MAVQFTAGVGGRLKPIFKFINGDGFSSSVRLDDAFHLHHHRHRRKVKGGGFGRPSSVPQRDRNRKSSYFFGGFTVHASSTSSARNSSRNNNSFDQNEILDHQDDPAAAAAAGFDDEIDDELAGFIGLVLDISYRPVNVVCWKRAICLEFMDKADVLEYYDHTINSPSGSYFIPAVLRVPHLLQVVKRRKVKRGLSRKNIFHRDNFTCQYCASSENLTIDHVLPIARGGKWTWENLVAACAKCNSKKGQKTLEEASMKLMKIPKAPKDFDILAIPLTNHAIKMLKVRKGMPEEWRQYLSKPYAAP